MTAANRIAYRVKSRYAVFHATTYRSRYAEFLKIDFPRLPLTRDVALFRSLCALGKELVALHLMEQLSKLETSYPEAGDNTVEAVRYKAHKKFNEEQRDLF